MGADMGRQPFPQGACFLHEAPNSTPRTRVSRARHDDENFNPSAGEAETSTSLVLAALSA